MPLTDWKEKRNEQRRILANRYAAITKGDQIKKVRVVRTQSVAQGDDTLPSREAIGVAGFLYAREVQNDEKLP